MLNLFKKKPSHDSNVMPPIQLSSTLALGKRGEQAVAQYLIKHGYSILEYNYRQRTGEIDIIARKKEVVACVEVKLRSEDYFPLSEVIVPSKQRKIITTARLFVSRQKLIDIVLRFDVALIHMKNNSSSITYLANAFTHNELY